MQHIIIKMIWYSLLNRNIGVEGGKAFAEALKINKTVTSIMQVL